MILYVDTCIAHNLTEKVLISRTVSRRPPSYRHSPLRLSILPTHTRHHSPLGLQETRTTSRSFLRSCLARTHLDYTGHNQRWIGSSAGWECTTRRLRGLWCRSGHLLAHLAVRSCTERIEEAEQGARHQAVTKAR